MTKQNEISSSVNARTGSSLTRLLVVVAVSALTVYGLVVGVRWSYYRYNHVVVSDAVVKGIVTRLGARIDGRVKSVEVEPGQHVMKGDILVTMEDDAYQAALDRARAEYDSATKELETERMAIDQSRKRLTLEVEQFKGAKTKAEGELEAARGNLASLEKQYDRVASLLKSGAAATAEMDQVSGERDHAQGMVNAAKGELDFASSAADRSAIDLEGLQVRSARLGVLEAQVVGARARVTQAEADLEATVIRSPGEGQVLERLVELGGSAKVGQPILSLWMGRGWVEAWVDERDLRKFDIGSPAEIVLWGVQGSKFAGSVEGIGLESDKQLQPAPVPVNLHSLQPSPSAMVPVRISFASNDVRLQLGLSATVGIQKKRGRETAEPRTVAVLPSPYKQAYEGSAQGKYQALNK